MFPEMFRVLIGLLLLCALGAFADGPPADGGQVQVDDDASHVQSARVRVDGAGLQAQAGEVQTHGGEARAVLAADDAEVRAAEDAGDVEAQAVPHVDDAKTWAAEDAHEVEAQAQARTVLDVEAILNEVSPASDYVEKKRCISTSSYRSIEVLDDHHLLFKGARGIWLNRLRHRCPLGGDLVFVVELSSSRLCDMDTVAGHDRLGFRAWRGRCVLGQFEQIDPQQAAALKAALAQAAKSRRRP